MVLGPYPSKREELVLEYVIYRLSDGARLEDIVREQYVRRHASPDEVQDILDNPQLVEGARRKVEEALCTSSMSWTKVLEKEWSLARCCLPHQKPSLPTTPPNWARRRDPAQSTTGRSSKEMVKSAAKKVMFVGRATVFMVGLAMILALTVGVASAAFGANGGNFILGQTNAATAITKLAGAAGVAGPSLQR
jgi:hypothetical protein